MFDERHGIYRPVASGDDHRLKPGCFENEYSHRRWDDFAQMEGACRRHILVKVMLRADNGGHVNTGPVDDRERTVASSEVPGGHLVNQGRDLSSSDHTEFQTEGRTVEVRKPTLRFYYDPPSAAFQRPQETPFSGSVDN